MSTKQRKKKKVAAAKSKLPPEFSSFLSEPGRREGLMTPKLKGGYGSFERGHDNRYDSVAPVPLPRLPRPSHCARFYERSRDGFLVLARPFNEGSTG